MRRVHAWAVAGLLAAGAAGVLSALVCSARADQKSALDAAVARASTYKNRGYSVRDTSQGEGLLKKEASTRVSTTCFGGNSYVFVVAGDAAAADIDIEVYDEKGSLISQDDAESPIAEAVVTPKVSGTYYINITMCNAQPAGATWVLVSAYM